MSLDRLAELVEEIDNPELTEALNSLLSDYREALNLNYILIQSLNISDKPEFSTGKSFNFNKGEKTKLVI